MFLFHCVEIEFCETERANNENEGFIAGAGDSDWLSATEGAAKDKVSDFHRRILANPNPKCVPRIAG